MRLLAGRLALPDDELCRGCLQGDLPAFAELLSRHREAVYRLVRRYCSRQEDAFDLVQRAFLQALEAARRSMTRLGREGPAPFRAWLFRIAINLGKNHARSERRWRTAPASEAEGLAAPSAPDPVERAEQVAQTRAAVLGLPRRQREVLTLRLDAGLSFAEIASTLGIQEGNARVHFHQAVRRLACRLRSAGEEKP
ncbi:MAG: sigma-70 family RNA polymerase sigma factor [Myxococcales bacterium]|nr:sigma-70 family RNA polymerase sigma factor [Myxococcales bacterium]